MNYTVSKSEILNLATARRVQAMRAERDELPQRACDATVAAVEWRNGRVDTRPLRIGRLAAWVALIHETKRVEISQPATDGPRFHAVPDPAIDPKIAVELRATSIRFRFGPSEIVLIDAHPLDTMPADYTPSQCVNYYGPAIVMDGNARPGEFVCVADNGDVASLKAELKTLRADKTREADFKTLKNLRAKLATATTRRTEVQAELEAAKIAVQAATAPAVAESRQLREIKRRARAFTRQLQTFLAGQSNFPTYEPWTPTAEFTASIADDEKTLARLMELNEADRARSWSNAVWKRDTRITNLRRKIVCAYVPAVADGLTVDGLCSIGRLMPGENVRNRNRQPALSVYPDWRGPRAELLNARRAVRQLPARLMELTQEIEMAEWKIAKLESKLVKGGCIKARAIGRDGQPLRAVICTPEAFSENLKKCTVAGIAVEILESGDAAFPVGIATAPALAQAA